MRLPGLNLARASWQSKQNEQHYAITSLSNHQFPGSKSGPNRGTQKFSPPGQPQIAGYKSTQNMFSDLPSFRSCGNPGQSFLLVLEQRTQLWVPRTKWCGANPQNLSPKNPLLEN